MKKEDNLNLIKGVLPDSSKSIPKLAQILSVSVVSLIHTTADNKVMQCICTLNKALVKKYVKLLNSKELSTKKLEFLDKKYNSTDVRISVYDLIEGKKITLFLDPKKVDWNIAQCMVLTEDNMKNIVSFINKTFPIHTSEIQKNNIKNVKS